ncbi:MAG: M23 family metallopeptidase [Candidatus Puniceispirillales bacterium]
MILKKIKIRNLSLSVFFLLLNFILALSSHAQTNVKQTNISNFDKNFKILGAEVISGYPVEGNLIVARTNPSNKIKINNEFLEIDESGIFVFGFHRDEENPIKLVIINNENEQFKTFIKPIKREYKIQRIDGLKKSMVTPPEDTISRIKSDRKKVNKARKVKLEMGDFIQGFDWPLKGLITGVYGSQRILNDIPKSPHFGIDISVPIGTSVKAPASGIVTLTEDLYYSGYTVILNHGLNINSTFLHLSEINVNVGDRIGRGDLIGHSGDTGRSTGPHLDWRIDWNGKRLDAEMLAGQMNN